ncbi:MAG: PilN domain-containing protein [Candidatus Omnitrophota bacterium]
MIKINLLPEELKKKRMIIELPEIPIIPISIGFVGTLFIIQLFLSGLIFFNEQRLERLEKKWKTMEPEKQELDKLKKSISSSSAKSYAIDKLIEKRISWARLLNEISNSLIGNVWLTELSYKKRIEGNVQDSVKSKKQSAKKSRKTEETLSYEIATLTLSGSSSGKGEEGTATIAKFINALKGNASFFKNFSDIELVSIKQGTLAGQDIMNFTIDCRFKPERIEKE